MTTKRTNTMLTTNNAKCDFCKGDLAPIYLPPTSERGAVVFLCRVCGLCQTVLYGNGDVKKRASVSSGASWGNIRYGKQFRVSQAMELLDVVDWDTPQKVLDIGSGRGDFLRAVKESGKKHILNGIEIDRSIASVPSDGNLHIGSFEKHVQFRDYSFSKGLVPVSIPTGGISHPPYSVISCIHTLEHLASPMAALRKIRGLLADDGYFIIDVPNIEAIAQPTFVEEFFIDKHLFHFSHLSLKRMLFTAGFDVVDERVDPANIMFLCRPTCEKLFATNLVERYRSPTTANRKTLFVCRSVKALNHRTGRVTSTAVWGGGRIFDALVCGGLKTDRIECVIDKYMPIRKIHDLRVVRPSEIGGGEMSLPELVIICSREYADDIEREWREIASDRVCVASDRGGCKIHYAIRWDKPAQIIKGF